MIFFSLSNLVCPLFLLNSATIFYFIQVSSPLEGVTRDGPLSPSHPRPPSDDYDRL